MSDLKKIRTDVVGSLLRPANLRDARIEYDEGKIGFDDFRAVEDEAVQGAVRLQESIGLDVISDGEMRRLNFQDSFGAAVEGYDANRSTLKVYERRVDGAAPLQRWDIQQMHVVGTAVSHRRPVKERLRLARNVPAGGISLCDQGGRGAGQSVTHWPGSHFPAVRLSGVD